MNERTAITAPEWFRTRAIYQINPRTFSAEGTIKAVTRELPFLASLGFGTMYLCPIFREDDSCDRVNWSERQKASMTDNPKNPYRMLDYFEIDSEYGTMDDLREFIRESHRLGMRVMLDLVYFHIGPNAPVLKTHPEFAAHEPDGNVRMTQWHFPLLNFESDGLREYLYTNMCYYIGVLDADGFRCDVGDGVPLDFWEEGRRRIRRIKSDAVLLNEGVKPEYIERAFDACYFFRWHETLYEVFSGKKTAEDLIKDEKESVGIFPANAIMMRDIDNHDTVTDWPERVEVIAGHDGMELIEAANFVMRGIPMVYTGNELADETELNMFANRFHPGRFSATDRGIRTKEYSLRRQEIIRRLNALRTEYPLLCGSAPESFAIAEQPERVIAFRREENGQAVVFRGNFSRETAADRIPAGSRVLLSRGAAILPDGRVTLEKYGYVIALEA